MTGINSRHSLVVLSVFGMAYLTLLVNLCLVQIANTSIFTTLGCQQYVTTVIEQPPRANIIDRNGTLLATNVQTLSAFIIPSKITDYPKVEQFLAMYFPHALMLLRQKRHPHFLFIKRRLSQDQQKLIEESGIKDICLLQEEGRFYPVAAAATIIGATDVDNKGLCGIELQAQAILEGRATVRTVHKDARSQRFYFDKQDHNNGHAGIPVQLTIDTDLQFFVHEAIKKSYENFNAKEASAIVMDPQSGHILAMACVPSFDPAHINEANLEDLKHRVVTQSYELGSVMKVFVALAAFEEELVGLDELIDCKNSKTTFIDGRKINTWKAHGLLPFIDVIALSNNIGIAQVAKRLNEKLYAHYVRLGFGKKTGICLSGEHAGFINPPDQWSKQSIISLSYGYEIATTIMQVARAFCVIANDGVDVQPRLVLKPDDFEKEKDVSKRLYSSESIQRVKTILKQVVTQGTARSAQIPGFDVFAKTGTANVLDENGLYDNCRNLYTCAGIISKRDYQRVIVVFVREANRPNMYAATVAVPLFTEIAKALVIHERVV